MRITGGRGGGNGSGGNRWREESSDPGGKRHNGGDGLVAARHLLNSGVMVETFLLGNPKELTPDATVNYSILEQLTERIYPLTEEEHLSSLFWHL